MFSGKEIMVARPDDDEDDDEDEDNNDNDGNARHLSDPKQEDRWQTEFHNVTEIADISV